MKHRQAQADLLEAAAGMGVPLTADQAASLISFERLLRELAIPRGIVARSDEPRLRERHVLDSLRAAGTIHDASSAFDLGSGAGLPGIVVAVVAPALRIGLVESRAGRAAFLELVVEALELPNAYVVARRAEFIRDRADLCFSRAFAPLREAWGVASRLLVPGGRLVYFAGSGSDTTPLPEGAELLEVRASLVLESAGPLVIMARQ